MKDITPKDLKARLDAGEDIDILDVREGWEVNIVALPNNKNIPMNDIPDEVENIAKDKPVVVMCHTGRRSEEVAYFLETEGFENILNLVGGIAAWKRDVDPSIPAY
jgi:sulfur-carrier protein adenylyltransferase/sulfurtransferase